MPLGGSPFALDSACLQECYCRLCTEQLCAKAGSSILGAGFREFDLAEVVGEMGASSEQNREPVAVWF
jgi:hypothetical protein